MLTEIGELACACSDKPDHWMKHESMGTNPESILLSLSGEYINWFDSVKSPVIFQLFNSSKRQHEQIGKQ